MAAHDFGGYFDAVDAALETASLSAALKSGTSTIGPLTKLIRASMIGGYEDGGSLIGKKPGSRYLDRALSDAQDRASEVSGQMLRTSRKWLKANPGNEFALSSARAERAARFEAARGYYAGLQHVLWGYGMLKSWLTTSDNPCEVCLDNEDQGPIPMEDVFDSGDDAPLAHLSCACVLEIIPPE